MTTENDSLLEKLRGYTLRSEEYLNNAYLSLEQGEVEKGGEFLWGSIAQALKAVAAFKGVELHSHRDIWLYARELSAQLGDDGLYTAFRDANYLHGNFYEAGLTLEMVLDSGERIKAAVGKLLNFIPRELLGG